MTEAQKRCAQRELNKAIAEAQAGDICGFRMKIKGIHAEAFGGNGGGRKSQMDNKGFTIIKMRGERMKKDAIEHPVEALPGNRHTAIFPLRIIRELIRLMCPAGGVVVDPYIGSGTTAVAAIEEKRNYFGIEIDPDYCNAARQRTGQAEDNRKAA